MTVSNQNPENRLPAERLKAFHEALEVLYIKSNLSGRLQFQKEWPAAGRYVFGEELSRHDREGFADKARRAALEGEAEERRLRLLEMAEGLEGKSVLDGALRADYVRGVIESVGREIALYLYAGWIVDKFLPPPVIETVSAPEPSSPTIPEKSIDLIGPISLDLPQDEASPPAAKSGLRIFGITEAPQADQQ